jgi:signal transduction histidine kinase
MQSVAIKRYGYSFLASLMICILYFKMNQSLGESIFHMAYPLLFIISLKLGTKASSFMLLLLIFGLTVLGLPFFKVTIFTLGSLFILFFTHKYFHSEHDPREREKRLKLALESSKIGIWEYSFKSKIGRTNIVRDIADDLDNFLLKVHSEDRDKVKEALNNSQTSGNLNMDFRFSKSDSLHWITVSGKVQYDANGVPVRILGTSKDITDNKKSEEALHEALFYRDEFLSIASHELKTPLTSLKLQSQLFKRSVAKNDLMAYSHERIDRLADEVDRQVKRLTRLVDDMLDISRIRSGKLSIQLEKVNLAALASEVLERSRSMFEDNDRAAPALKRCDPCEVQCDRLRIEQVMSNLLNNAYRYGRGLPVAVEVITKENKAHISIIDQGIGIDGPDIEKVFTRFRRAVPASEVSGLGLGLYIAKQIVEAHGGAIRVDSELNIGSTFTVELPLV